MMGACVGWTAESDPSLQGIRTLSAEGLKFQSRCLERVHHSFAGCGSCSCIPYRSAVGKASIMGTLHSSAFQRVLSPVPVWKCSPQHTIQRARQLQGCVKGNSHRAFTRLELQDQAPAVIPCHQYKSKITCNRELLAPFSRS